MKHAIIAALALACAACTTPAAEAPPSATEPSAQPSQAARYFGAAERTYLAAAAGVDVAVDLGVVRGATATQVRQLNARARTLMVTGKAAADLTAARELFAIAGRLNILSGSN